MGSGKISRGFPAWGWGFIGVAFGLVLVFLGYFLWTGKSPIRHSLPTFQATFTFPAAEGSPQASATPQLSLTVVLPGSSTRDTPQTNSTPVSAPPCTQIGQVWISPQDGMKMVCVPAGPFLMGSDPKRDPDALANEFPQHSVTLPAFWIDSTEVTNAMFTAFFQATAYRTDAEQGREAWVLDLDQQAWVPQPGAFWMQPHGQGSNILGLENYPVVQMSWNDAHAYCAWAGKQLPTEAQWEKAARGTDGRIFPWGDQPPTGDLLNLADRSLKVKWADSSIDDGHAYAAPVGSYPEGASPYGALDMAGNVWEWVADWYDEQYYTNSPLENPPGAFSGILRAVRGGGWAGDRVSARSADRDAYVPMKALEVYGFRCVSGAPQE